MSHSHSSPCVSAESSDKAKSTYFRLGYTADITTKLSYLDAMTNSDAKTALPKLVGGKI